MILHIFIIIIIKSKQNTDRRNSFTTVFCDSPGVFTFSGDEFIGNTVAFDRDNSSSKVSENSSNTRFVLDTWISEYIEEKLDESIKMLVIILLNQR